MIESTMPHIIRLLFHGLCHCHHLNASKTIKSVLIIPYANHHLGDAVLNNIKLIRYLYAVAVYGATEMLSGGEFVEQHGVLGKKM